MKRLIDELPFGIRKQLRRKYFVPKFRRGIRRGDNIHCLREYEEKRCIFVHIPKAAGLSISASLFGGRSTHFSAYEYKLLFGTDFFDKSFKFTIVRNPWDRLYSAYEFLKRKGISHRDQNWADRHLKEFYNFNDFVIGWVNKKNIYKYVHFIPQFEFICDENGRILIDFIGRIETIKHDFASICKRLNIRAFCLHLNKVEKATYKQVYTRKTIDIVAKVYKRDIKLFGYTF